MAIVRVSRVPRLRPSALASTPLPPRLRGDGVKMEALERRLLFAAGDPDLGFGTGGLLVHNVGGAAEIFNGGTAVAEDAVGRLLVTGHSEHPAKSPESNGTLWVGRFLADGSVDTTFGDNGNVWITNVDATGQHIALQSDGKIVVAGYLHEEPVTGLLDFGVWRFNTDGSLDTTFGVNGMVRTNLGGHEWAFGMTINDDDKIVVVGAYEEIDLATYSKKVMDALIVRYNADGSLDTTFGNGGVVRDDLGGDYDFARDVHVQADGKIVIGGGTGKRIDSPEGTRASSDFAVARYNADGTRDATFGAGGVATTAFGPAHGGGEGRALHVDAQGRVTVVGRVFPENFENGIEQAFVAFARFTAGGQLDNTFGTGGVRRAAEIDYAWNMTADAAGNFILSSTRPQGYDKYGSYIGIGMRPEVEVSRFRSDGSLDETFGDGGFARLVIAAKSEFAGMNGAMADGLIVTRDGDIVVAGMAHGNGADDAVLARFLGDDVAPPSPAPEPEPESPPPAEQPDAAAPPFDNPAYDNGKDDEGPAWQSLWSDDLLDPGKEDDEEGLLAGLT